MYRYIVDNAVTYTPDDFVLYRESPFAIWMERLTLENPDHGIHPDLHSSPPADSAECQGAIVDTLRMEGRDVALVDWDLDEAERRRRTIAAMRDGADFIVDGQLAIGALSGTANLLMRTSGYSDLGDFLYIPCDTQDKTTLQSAFRLCFLADLLHSLQGQLPPQMLVIRGDADVVPLQTEDHIYYFRAAKQRFMDDMREFRKHVIPDPSESVHFGRWSDCASEVMKQRTLQAEEEAFEREQEMIEEEPALRVAGAAGDAMALDDAVASQSAQQAPVTGLATGDSAGQTLAEQARQLDPGSLNVDAAPGRAPNLSSASSRPALAEVPAAEQSPAYGELPAGDTLPGSASDDIEAAPLLQATEEPVATSAPAPGLLATGHDPLGDLSFIGSNSLSSSFDVEPIEPPQDWRTPAPTLDMDSDHAGYSTDDQAEPDGGLQARPLPDLEPPEPALLPPEDLVVAVSAREPGKPHPLDSTGASVSGAGLVDFDGAPPPGLAPLPAEIGMDDTKTSAPRDTATAAPQLGRTEATTLGADPDEVVPRRPFSDSLLTSGDLDDD